MVLKASCHSVSRDSSGWSDKLRIHAETGHMSGTTGILQLWKSTSSQPSARTWAISCKDTWKWNFLTTQKREE